MTYGGSDTDFPKYGNDQGLQPEDDENAPGTKMSDEALSKLDILGSELAHKRDDWVRQRRSTGIDKRWDQDVDQYHMRDEANRSSSQMMEAAEQGYPVTKEHARATRSTVFIGLTRQKSNAAEARLADILLPTDDRNWGIQPMPIPKLLAMMGSQQPAVRPADGTPAVHPQTGVAATQGAPVMNPLTGQQATQGEVAEQIHLAAKQACDGMQDEIDNQLNESDYNGELRKAIHNAVVLGTGVIKGPIVENRFHRAWKHGTDSTGAAFYEMHIEEEALPASYAVDPRNVFVDPGCGDNHQNGEGLFEREIISGKQLRDLAKQPGYLVDQLRKVLIEGPKRSATMERPIPGPDKDIDTSYLNKNYEMWHYWGEVTYDDAVACGIDESLLPGLDADDPLSTVNVCVVVVNDSVVKAYINPIDTGDFPYDFYVWEKVTGSVYGYGIPYLMRAQQKVINSAWRQLMDNLGITAGPQIVLQQGKISPADGEWSITSRKIWFADASATNVKDVMTSIEFNSHADELINVIKFAMQLVDEETSAPMIWQGERGTAPDTVGGMQMLMNSSNVVLRRLVKQFDDMVTRPHIRRYYDYNMLYSDKDEIKGDFRVDARGSSALLVKDIQNQAFMNLLQIANNPTYAIFLNLEELFKKALQAQHIDPADIMATDAQIQQRQQAASQAKPAPAVEVAQIKMQGEGQRGQVNMQMKQAELAMAEKQMEIDRATKLQELQAMKENLMLTLATKQNISLDQIKKSLAQMVMQTNTQKELAAAAHHLDAQSLLNDQQQTPEPSKPGPYDQGQGE